MKRPDKKGFGYSIGKNFYFDLDDGELRYRNALEKYCDWLEGERGTDKIDFKTDKVYLEQQIKALEINILYNAGVIAEQSKKIKALGKKGKFNFPLSLKTELEQEIKELKEEIYGLEKIIEYQENKIEELELNKH